MLSFAVILIKKKMTVSERDGEILTSNALGHAEEENTTKQLKSTGYSYIQILSFLPLCTLGAVVTPQV